MRVAPKATIFCGRGRGGRGGGGGKEKGQRERGGERVGDTPEIFSVAARWSNTAPLVLRDLGSHEGNLTQQRQERKINSVLRRIRHTHGHGVLLCPPCGLPIAA